MKNIFLLLFPSRVLGNGISLRTICTICAILFSAFHLCAQVEFNPAGSSTNASALFELTATDKGMLVPRMTSAQRTVIASPATGLLVFDTTTGSFWFHNGTGWVNLSAAPNRLQDADGDTKIQVEESPNEDIIRFDLGGTENMVLRKNASGHTRLELPNTLANTFVGQDAGNANSTGERNSAFGKQTLSQNSTGVGNTAIGWLSLASNSTGNANTASDAQALFLNSTGGVNSAYGANALTLNSTGSANSAIGWTALVNNTMGSGNTGLGAATMNGNTIGSNNTGIGNGADVLSNNLTNATAIGYNAKVGASNSLVLGGTGADAVQVGIGTQTPGYPLHLDVNGTGFAHTSGSVTLTTFADPTYSPAGGWIGTASNHPLHFFADNPAAPQMTLTQNGDLGIGISTIPAGIKLQVEGNIATTSGNSVYVGGVTNAGADGLRMHQTAGGSYIDHKGAGDLLFRADNGVGGTPRMFIKNNGNVGIGRNPVTNLLEVEGDASKFSAGDWLANSDARLKKNISPLDSREMLEKLLALQGVTYEWNDDKTGSKRPEGIQYGFTAQNIQTVFPTLVEEDKLGYLQTAYGTYDAMTVEAIRALHSQLRELGEENEALKAKVETLTSQLDKITAALAGAGIAVEK